MDLALTSMSPAVLDPAYALTLEPIYALACALWDGWAPRQWILRSWTASFNRYVDGSVSWMTVADPISAAAASCARIGWSSPRPGVLRTHEGVVLSLDNVCPKTVLKLGQYAVEDWLLCEMVRKRDYLRGFGPAAVPWIYPLARLVKKRPTPGWTQRHQAMLRTVVADGLWPAARLHDAGLIPTNECAVCGAEGTSHHRAWCCSGRDTFRAEYVLPEGYLPAAKAQPSNPLWTHAFVVDPTRTIPPPIDVEPEWTVIPRNHRRRFRGSAFGDGSAVMPFGPRSCRAGYSVVQIDFLIDQYVLTACALGPLPGPYQSSPAAELYALLVYLQHLDDEPDAMFYSDCDWVVKSFALGEAGTTGATHVHADLWRRVWTLHARRHNAVLVLKVRGHASQSSGDFCEYLADGNSFADAGAKEGRLKHPSDIVAEVVASGAFEVVTTTAKFLARVMVASADASDDVPPHDMNPRLTSDSNRRRTAPIRHAPVSEGCRVRCGWCMRIATNVAALNRSSCIAASRHAIWKASGLSICLRCGAYSEKRSVLLSSPCTGVLSARGGYNVKRVFDTHLHPKHDVPVGPPIFWQRGPVGKIQDGGLDLDCGSLSREPSTPAVDRYADLHTILARVGARRGSHSGVYGRSSADADRFAIAVRPPEAFCEQLPEDPFAPSAFESQPDDPFGHGFLLDSPADFATGAIGDPGPRVDGSTRLEAVRSRIRARVHAAEVSTVPSRRRYSYKQPPR